MYVPIPQFYGYPSELDFGIGDELTVTGYFVISLQELRGPDIPVIADPSDVDRQLLPLLRGHLAPSRDKIGEWTERLIAESRDLLSAVLPMTENEVEFLDRLNGRGEIAPELLTSDGGLQSTIASHPGLRWKALHARNQLGFDSNPNE